MIQLLQIEPAPARGKYKDELWDNPHITAEEKYDGWRFLLHIGGKMPRMHLTGRNISTVTGAFTERGLNAPFFYPKTWPANLTIIDGEVMPPEGAHFRDLAGIMNTDADSALKRIAEIGHPQYVAFDILYNDGEDVREKPLSERRALLVDVLTRHYSMKSGGLPPHITFSSYNNTTKALFYEQILARGGEGVILKDLRSSYGGASWYKVKRQATLDVVITGYTEANEGITGKYKGQIGAIKVSVLQEGSYVEVGQVSGMVDSIRKEISDAPGEYLWRVIEIKAQELAKDRLRHPRFLRFRPDAKPANCTWEKMLADLKASDAGVMMKEEER